MPANIKCSLSRYNIYYRPRTSATGHFFTAQTGVPPSFWGAIDMTHYGGSLRRYRQTGTHVDGYTHRRVRSSPQRLTSGTKVPRQPARSGNTASHASRDQQGPDAARQLPAHANEKNPRDSLSYGDFLLHRLAERTGLEPATPGVTGRYSNQLNYHSATASTIARDLPPKQAPRLTICRVQGSGPTKNASPLGPSI